VNLSSVKIYEMRVNRVMVIRADFKFFRWLTIKDCCCCDVFCYLERKVKNGQRKRNRGYWGLICLILRRLWKAAYGFLTLSVSSERLASIRVIIS